ncbi:unnamed protein product [Paramecium primaurelia]|uniref:Uncharacterized protein n=1 Tax=Paramecium primaurelia TaxID=5886 RepID=A0A8S1QHF0_PARPR|nr:unnamed protein product [Paramecium primaurelia]
MPQNLKGIQLIKYLILKSYYFRLFHSSFNFEQSFSRLILLIYVLFKYNSKVNNIGTSQIFFNYFKRRVISFQSTKLQNQFETLKLLSVLWFIKDEDVSLFSKRKQISHKNCLVWEAYWTDVVIKI